MKVLVIAGNSVRRLLRDRTNIFFVFLMPLLLILVLGSAFGGAFDSRVGVVAAGSGELGEDLTDRIMGISGVVVTEYDDNDALVLAVERGELEAGVMIPEGFDSALRDGEQVTVEFIARPEASAQALRNTVDAVVTEQGSLLRAATFAQEYAGADFAGALAAAEEVAAETEGLAVEQRVVGEPSAFQEMGRFDLGAYSQLLLFVFITSTTASAALIESRQLGVSLRMLSTPTSMRTVLGGELLGRVAVALFQGLIIIVGTSLMFGVDWGDPIGAAATFILFALGAGGVGMLMGAVFKRHQQAEGVGVMIGIGMAALGGAMVPLSVMRVFSQTLYRVAHITPHAWGISAFEQLVLYGGGISDVLPQLGVLATFAAAVIALGAWRLRIALTRG